MKYQFSHEQCKRLSELGVEREILDHEFDSKGEANHEYQLLEKKFSRNVGEGIRQILQEARRPPGVLLKEKLASSLSRIGFTEVETPLTVTRLLLERMGLSSDHALQKQIFWLDENRAIRPMLAPNLYYILVDLLRITKGIVSIFEIGPCMRKESQGARHGEEFTMLNIVEMGLPLENRRARIEELARFVLKECGLPLDSTRFEVEDSGVYGETLDVVSPEGLELASTAMGPHPLDKKWNVTVPWVGLGFGLERLLMAKAKADGSDINLAKAGRSLSYFGGYPLNIP
jgi:phenylalanyl-tRNA synthetase alpha chain